MVNTRRTESGGNHRYHTRRTNDGVRHIDTSSGSESEELQGDDESWSPHSKSDILPLNKSESALPPRVRELRSRFVYDNRKFKSYHLRKTDVVDTRKHPKLKGRLEVYVAHKHRMDNMDSYNPNDSEEDCYSPRHSSRRRHRTLMGRVERRTALSLRPLTAKSYVDRSPMTCHSDDSDVVGVRRSARQRNPQYKSLGSWITDDQMPKKGYPNAEEYSEEDSRDAQVKRLPSRREIKKNTRYLNDYQTTDIPTNRRNRRLRNEDESIGKSVHSLRGHRSHYDGHENKERSARSTRQTRNSGGKPENGENETEHEKAEDEDENENEEDKVHVEDNNGIDDELIVEEEKKPEKIVKKETQKNNGIMDKSSNDGDEKIDQISKETSESDVVAPRVTRKRSNRIMDDSYCLRKNRQIRKVSESSTSSEEGRVYALRERVPKTSNPIIMREISSQSPRSDNRRSRRRFRRKRSPSPSDTSDEDERVRNKYSKNPKSPHSKNEPPLKSGAGGSKIIPIGPEKLDSNVRFSSVGGLDSHIQCLKEMVLLPMMYPEVFEKFQVQPPRGVLFYGPPGTGKTLIARALANECCFGARKVAFFMRKGADLLSKWIGESEKQLRLLFEQAAEMKPSIIFFDEIDGLAPIRSSRQDQVHASIVSTLLALMDGLDNRGEVIVIGATNRIDAIDPALRRPGRFDRELFFPLPAKTEREEIIKVHISKWASKPSEQMINYLAENSVGYCGSDLRALCSEAVIQSFRRTYPQVYNSDHKLLLDPEQVKIEKVDFLRAKSYLVPSSHRSGQRTGRKLLPSLQPLLDETLKEVHSLLTKLFPHGSNPSLAKVKLAAGFRPAQFIIVGDSADHGQTNHLAPAILHSMEHINVHVLDITTLYQETGRSAEEACIQVFQEVKRNVPSVLYIPCVDQWWNLVSETVKTIFNNQLECLEPNSPILIFATANSIYSELSEELQFIFSPYRKEVYEIKSPSSESRKNFFKPLIIDTSIKCPRSPRKRPKTPFELPKAPTPPPVPLSKEQERKLYEVEEHTLRELRIFLRDMCKKLANNRLFYMFTKPVDTEEVPDYPTIIKQPMDLETMMMKVDFHRYECAKDFLNDIELIVQNALEYNPAKTSADKQIRHRACSLRDYAYTLIKNEMDSDFEDKCQDISKKRVERKASTTQYLPPFLQTQPEEIILINGKPPNDQIQKPTLSNGTSTTRTSPNRKRKLPSWQRGLLTSRKKKRREKNPENEGAEENIDDKSSDESKDNNMDSENTNGARISYSEDSHDMTNSLTPLTVDCTSNIKTNNPLQSPNAKRRLSDLMSPSELLQDTLDFDDVDQALNETSDVHSKEIVEISENELNKILNFAVEVTTNQSLQSLLDLHYQLSRIIKQYSKNYNRTKLPDELMSELKRYQEETEINTADLSEDLNNLRNI
ncbi:ATPase family AAA domain-containing protein 2-like isoform X2 [Onthophagus taurus]|uniref:ATPase family AAA domain-containing protein 2-like isoform X2 n=1 Tax=Onthophagus taurus TaxID=166361 RepID=UPI000C1FE106|nr:ATPase family AAA domain-containing protein 2-like isoform X2 [Onthophagus taurus]